MKKTLILVHAVMLLCIAGIATTASATECAEAQQQAINFYSLAIPQPSPLKTQYVFGLVLSNTVANSNFYVKPAKSPRITVSSDGAEEYIDCAELGNAGYFICHTANGILPIDAKKSIAITAQLKLGGLGSCTYEKTILLKEIEQFFPEYLDIQVMTDETEADCEENGGMVCPGFGMVLGAMPLVNALWDFDGDGLHFLVDDQTCPFANGTECKTSGADADQDGDGILDAEDNCPYHINPEQSDTDDDEYGDPCDLDRDDDGKPNHKDNCHLVANKDQADADQDGLGDACDDGTTFISCENDLMICTTVPGTYCDPTLKQCLPFADKDGDGIPDVVDQCPEFGTELDPCAQAPAATIAPPPIQPTTGEADGGGGCSLQTSAPEHSTGVYLLLSFIAVMSALGITRTQAKD